MSRWVEICKLDDLQPDSGVCALIFEPLADGRRTGQQIALFYFSKRQEIYAVANFDPIGKANVLSRGMIGDLGGEPMVASPLHKQHYSLKTGVCFEEPTVAIKTYPVRVEENKILISA